MGSTRTRPHGWDRRDARSSALVELRVPEAFLDALLTGPPPGVDPHLWAAWTPVLADIATGYAAARLATEPDPRRRTPDTALRQKVITAIQFCVGPFCHVPSRRAQIDHGDPHATGGPTLFRNLGPLCGGQHRQKTKGHLHLQRCGLWTFQWTTRLGATYHASSPRCSARSPTPTPTPRR